MKGILSLLLLTSFIYITLSAKADEGSIVVSMKSEIGRASCRERV